MSLIEHCIIVTSLQYTCMYMYNVDTVCVTTFARVIIHV